MRTLVSLHEDLRRQSQPSVFNQRILHAMVTAS